MVLTRAKQPGMAAQATALLNAASNNASASLDSSNLDAASHDTSDTIGSRLRKRRRTHSTPSHESSPSRKRLSLPKTASPESKRTSPDRKRTSSYTKHISPKVRPLSIIRGNHPGNGPFANGNVQLRLDATSSLLDMTQDAINASETPLQPTLPIPPPDLQLLSSDHEAALKQAPPENVSDMAALMMRIVDRGEQIDNAQELDNEYSMTDPEDLPITGSSMHLKAQSLPILDNLATQILNRLGNSTFSEILTMVTVPDSELGHNYSTLMSLFDHTKKVYSLQDSFLNISDLGLTGQGAIDAVRKANLATFVSSVFGSQHVGFYHLNEYFLDTFVADGNRLLKSQAGLFLDLKTQAYISALGNGERFREAILEDLFPVDLEERLLSRRQGAKQLAPSEADFLQRARNRCKVLLDEPNTEAAIETLPDKYVWEDFLRDVSNYVSKNFEMLVGVPVSKSDFEQTVVGLTVIKAARKLSRSRPNGVATDVQQQHDQSLSRTSPQLTAAEQYQQQVQEYRKDMQAKPQSANVNGSQGHLDNDDVAGKAARAAQFAMQSFVNGHHMPPHMMPHPQIPHPSQHMQSAVQRVNPGPQQYPGLPQHPGFTVHPSFQPPHPLPHLPGPPQQFQFQFQHHQPNLHPQPPNGYYVQHLPINGHMGAVTNQHRHLYADANGIPYLTQSAPTQVLYERARQAATAKTTPSNRRSGTPSQRRPWTTEEENALMAGLDRVKGPHWSQILAMFGPGGTINESLKDRNQVQLKDKARNLKLFFLKSGIEVPYYLQFVTGEMKTRAPAQAAKHEEGRGPPLPGSSEDREHVEAVMALGGMARAGVDGSSALNGQNTSLNGNTGPQPDDATIGSDDDQKPLPSIGEHAAGSRNRLHSADDAQARRDSTISATEVNAEAEGLTHYEMDLKRRLSETLANDAAAEAAAEAARAIALMGQR
ncbi:TTAGGG repeat binding factor [Lambiella insularis]|nr:TTAGGG repeat binding factor [Lambiella insularis]